MPFRPRELVIRARETAIALVRALDRGEMVEKFLDIYAAENRRPGRADHPGHYREQLETIRRESILTEGNYVPIRSRNDVFAFIRRSDEGEILVALNLAHEPRRFSWQRHGRLLLSSHLDREEGTPVEKAFLLRADEGLIVRGP